VVVVIADGLSAAAPVAHAAPLLSELSALAPARWANLPVVLAKQARVALGDAVGAALQARLVLVLIGERPGMSAHDSLGAYLTYAPYPGRTDAERNCVSNIRPQGLDYAQAAHHLHWLVEQALARQVTGIELKDESGAIPLHIGAAPANIGI
jgi:ethanolamine ammonia-lyase small subunit